MKKTLLSFLFLLFFFLSSVSSSYALGNLCTLNIYPAPSIGTNNYNIRWTNDTGELTKFLVLRDYTGIEFNPPVSPITPGWYDNPVYPDSISISSSTGVPHSEYIDFIANITFTDVNASPITSSSDIISGYNGDHWGCDGFANITNINYSSPSPTPPPSTPITKDQCKKDGWMNFVGFKNQGSCVSFVEKLKSLLHL